MEANYRVVLVLMTVLEMEVADGFIDAAGATVQIFMFAVLARKVKQNAPRCHTFLEIIHTRYGRISSL